MSLKVYTKWYTLLSAFGKKEERFKELLDTTKFTPGGISYMLSCGIKYGYFVKVKRGVYSLTPEGERFKRSVADWVVNANSR